MGGCVGSFNRYEMAADANTWPHVIIDALDACEDQGSSWRRRREAFVPVLTARRRSAKRSRSEPPDQPLVENEVGLCEALEAVASRVDKSALCAASRTAKGPTAAPTLPNLSSITQQQQGFEFPLRVVDLSSGRSELGAPLLFSSLVHNCSDEATCICAFGSRWVLPRRSAFFLSRARRWRELAPLTLSREPACDHGYRLLLLDPPWHSRSVERAQTYETHDMRELLRDLAPAARALASRTACLFCVWVTNAAKVQRFVEETLFRSCGARPIARWYWLKLAVDGSWASGSEPSSPHRKPWEVCLIGYAGEAPPPPLPPRLAIACVPYAEHHSAKPALDPLLREHAAAHLLGAPDLDPQAAWEQLPKLEMFARDVRAHWHACGDEVLRYQHESFHERIVSDV